MRGTRLTGTIGGQHISDDGRSDQERLVLATGRYIDEGFDDRRLDTLFLTMPISWKGTLAQYVRFPPGKGRI